jgi:hypothetical protein
MIYPIPLSNVGIVIVITLLRCGHSGADQITHIDEDCRHPWSKQPNASSRGITLGPHFGRQGKFIRLYYLPHSYGGGDEEICAFVLIL